MKENLAKKYNPKEFEDRLYKYWMESGNFKAEVNKDKEPFTIMMPPPNVTGILHMGHALNNSIQDALIRYKRMQGFEALWLPGTDHASISTESKVVAKIKSEGSSKEELGREKFLEKSWEWTEKYGGNIKKQLKKLGVSCDWSKDRFTLDEGLSNAVEEVFIRLYEKGLIYRGNRIINWCPECKTAISDAEVDHKDENGKLWHIKYPVKGEDIGLTIATTRPETMLGDVAVAVHPEDERYKNLIGKTLILPLVNREIPIIADDYVEKEFGSGAVKITPAHDPNDYEIGLRHNLEQIIIMNEDATINEKGGRYAGLDRYTARKQIVSDLEAEGLLVNIEEHAHNVGHCERCKATIEPSLSKQWFVKMKPLAEPAIEAVKSGKIKFIPERFKKIYMNWLENIRDWCISRQLWWGHRLPVYYCDDCGEVIVSRDAQSVCTKCSSKNIRQDSDTLDTWFSSALWPFSTLGWPENTEELKYFFPTDVLVTGYDIIFFWVVRMVFSSIENMGEVPFDKVMLTGLVRDAQGRKMSKSLGNGIDPLEIIDQYGADALRFSLVTGNSPGNDMKFNIERVESSRNFANKLWNASRFVMMNLGDYTLDRAKGKKYELKPEDKWILSRVNTAAKEISYNIDKYELGMAAHKIYDFIWNEYCDWYIEIVKPRLYGDNEEDKETVKFVLLSVLVDILKLLHPFMPFITEEIFQHIGGTNEDLMVSEWPRYDANREYKEDEKILQFVMEAIKNIRNIRAEMNVVNSKKCNIVFVTQSDERKEMLKKAKEYFITLASASDISILGSKDEFKEDAMSTVVDDCEIFLPMNELVDMEKEIERLQKEKKRLEGELKRVKGKLSNEGFLKKAPPHLVEEEKQKQNKYQTMMDKVEERLAGMLNK
ncbi:valine--tRNA ligase [Clostridiaceae bacterium M8S5]|nr:valine--tRNA ligase [Clostridiaceae bacterium M8S5]